MSLFEPWVMYLTGSEASISVPAAVPVAALASVYVKVLASMTETDTPLAALYWLGVAPEMKTV